MSVRAKMKLSSIKHFEGEMKQLHFESHYDDAIPEDRRFQKYTPNAHAEFLIDNPAATDQFEIGKYYYVDFSPAE